VYGEWQKMAVLRRVGSRVHPAALAVQHNDKSMAEYGYPIALAISVVASQPCSR
jgi:hypothetical protein